ncbi:hypothetical protein IQ06DRAFT_311479 [Phaeosphaeriaceae sp. SRC1lsM3a]|nr:hypothetical protein IQ06DRAFT_311479 [Stagonospora sp. SRC1lsM3a]
MPSVSTRCPLAASMHLFSHSLRVVVEARTANIPSDHSKTFEEARTLFRRFRRDPTVPPPSSSSSTAPPRFREFACSCSVDCNAVIWSGVPPKRSSMMNLGILCGAPVIDVGLEFAPASCPGGGGGPVGLEAGVMMRSPPSGNPYPFLISLGATTQHILFEIGQNRMFSAMHRT